ncbi:carboxymuconolactone decarboxylase family protein [Streptomyces ardesiacus]|uniref:carboxymuconolactone decarboxylase family protein n=1 Tax=Streptomyces ardesiacus TaxID=285564 RepID=UPI0006E2E628|nr:carboxymuconolactone decarboxylase family protein [Streptomyces sp. NBRC 110030]
MAHAERPLSLPARAETDPDPAIAEVLAKAKAQTGMIPNMYARMANVPGLLDAYLSGYNSFRRNSGFTPAEQETVLLTISRVNGCTYCVAAHSALADMNKVPTEVTDALRDGKPLPDARLDALSTFTAAMVESRGLPTAAQIDAFLAAGYTETDILQILLAVSVKTISNYTNHLFHTPVDEMFAHRAWEE